MALTEPPLNPTFRAQINASSSVGCSSLSPLQVSGDREDSMYSPHGHFLAGAIGIDVSPLRAESHLPHLGQQGHMDKQPIGVVCVVHETNLHFLN